MTQCKGSNFRFNGSLHVSRDFRTASIDSDMPPAALKAGNRDREAKLYTSPGFLRIEGSMVDDQEYLDFRHMTWYQLDLKSDLKFGVLPSGLLIRCPNGEVRVVVDSKLCPMDEKLQVVRDAL